MMSSEDDLAIQFGAIASEAGKIVMSFYDAGVGMETKADGSPVSEADRASENLIRERLEKVLPGVAIIAEESFDPKTVAAPETFLLVDPLDGTREFASRNGEFTVNIALIRSGRPIVGCVFLPAANDMYVGGTAAFRAHVKAGDRMPQAGAMQRIRTRAYPAAGLHAAISRSHLDPETEHFLARLPLASRASYGSALKFCVIARGDADVYPRFAPTMEWDVAAGHAVLAAAGGCVMAPDGAPLRYGRIESGFRNDAFVAWGREPQRA